MPVYCYGSTQEVCVWSEYETHHPLLNNKRNSVQMHLKVVYLICRLANPELDDKEDNWRI